MTSRSPHLLSAGFYAELCCSPTSGSAAALILDHTRGHVTCFKGQTPNGEDSFMHSHAHTHTHQSAQHTMAAHRQTCSQRFVLLDLILLLNPLSSVTLSEVLHRHQTSSSSHSTLSVSPPPSSPSSSPLTSSQRLRWSDAFIVTSSQCVSCANIQNNTKKS